MSLFSNSNRNLIWKSYAKYSWELLSRLEHILEILLRDFLDIFSIYIERFLSNRLKFAAKKPVIKRGFFSQDICCSFDVYCLFELEGFFEILTHLDLLKFKLVLFNLEMLS